MIRYGLIIDATEDGVFNSKFIEGCLREGKQVVDESSGSDIKMVAWPTDNNGDQVKNGHSILLMEGNIINLARRIIACIMNRGGLSSFMLGWPKKLEIVEAL